MRVSFPEGFLWGASTSAHQVEGGNSLNDWWRFEQEGRVPEPSGAACDQFHLYEQDFDLAVELGHSAHRLSIEWSRIEPRQGEFDQDAIDHYVRVLMALKSRGLTSFVTLHHFTNPLWFADAGGWTWSGAPDRFGRYAEAVAPALAPFVDFWMTINEPTSITFNGYLFGDWPPGRRFDVRGAYRQIDTMAAAHIKAAAAIRAASPDAQVGFADILMNWRCSNPASGWQRGLHRFMDDFANHRFCDQVAHTLDFVGVQYYHTLKIGWRPYGPGHLAGADTTDIGWNIAPEGIEAVVTACRERYGLPIYITENGLADATDAKRSDFIDAHLMYVSRAIDAGADVRGYLHWSLIDNFEWAFGYGPRFGLVEVDYATQTRTPRPSAYHYRDIIIANGFEVPSRGTDA